MRKLMLLVVVLGMAASARADLVHHWPLNGDLLDVVGGNDGTATGTVTFAEGFHGVSNSAISVTASDFVSSASALSLVGQVPRTVSGWFKVATNQSQSVFCYGGRTLGLDLWEIDFTSDRKIFGHFWGGGYDTLTGTTQTFSLNQWVMATLVYDGTTVYVYQNGALINQKALTLATTSSLAYIGGGNDSGGLYDYDQFSGQIDDVKIWDTALTPAEVLSDYNQFMISDLIHHWPLDGDLLDVAGGNDCTATGTVTFADGIDGVSNSAISVTASDFVSSIDNLSIAGPAARTINFWFKSAEIMESAVSYGSRSLAGQLFEVLLDYPDDGYAGHFWGGGVDTYDTGSGDQPSVTWNTWNMVTMTYDGTDVKLYQNGVLKRTATLALDTTSTKIYIGGGNGSGGQWDYDQFSGQIDEVKIWSIALTPTEVLSEYNQFINIVATIDVGDGVAVDEESTASDTYSIVMLESPPADAAGGIKIVLNAADYTGQLTLAPNPNIIVFTTGNWSTPQTVTVTAIDDAVGEGPHSVTLYHEIDWVDPAYVVNPSTDPHFVLPKIENPVMTVDIIDDAATNPQPADLASDVPAETSLQWTPGASLTSQTVYFGTDNPPTTVVATGDGTLNSVANSALNGGDPLNKLTTYYWRVDSNGPGGPSSGNVWSFTTSGHEALASENVSMLVDISNGRITSLKVDGSEKLSAIDVCFNMCVTNASTKAQSWQDGSTADSITATIHRHPGGKEIVLTYDNLGINDDFKGVVRYWTDDDEPGVISTSLDIENNGSYILEYVSFPAIYATATGNYELFLPGGDGVVVTPSGAASNNRNYPSHGSMQFMALYQTDGDGFVMQGRHHGPGKEPLRQPQRKPV